MTQFGHAKAEFNDLLESVETVLQILSDVIELLGPVIGDPLCRWLLILLFFNREQGLQSVLLTLHTRVRQVNRHRMIPVDILVSEIVDQSQRQRIERILLRIPVSAVVQIQDDRVHLLKLVVLVFNLVVDFELQVSSLGNRGSGPGQ